MRIVIATLFAVAACAVASAQDFIAGSVVDTLGAPIAGAQIVCGDTNGTTRADGKFLIPCAERRITVSAQGFRTATVYVGIAPIVLDPIGVAATVDVTRLETDLAGTAASVRVVDREQLTNSGSFSLDDRLRQVPGFTLFRRAGSSTANPTTQGVSLRGVGASGASRALVLNDGVPLNDPFGGWIYWGRVAQESIREVELMRGPASDLYGSSAVGGVISILDRDPSDGPFADVDLAYGNESSPFGSFFGGLGNSRLRGSLAAEAYRTDGFIPTAPEARGTVDTLANVSRYTISPRLEYHHGSPMTAFAVLGLYQERRHNGSPAQNNDTRIAHVTLGLDAKTHAGTFAGRVYGLTEKYHQSFSAIAANRQTESLNRLQRVPSQALGASGQWTSSIRKHAIFAGLDLREIRGRSDETAISNGIATATSTGGGRETTFGGFAGGVFEWKRISLNGGLRHDAWWNSNAYSATRSLTGSSGTLTRFQDRFESRVSPRVSLLARITPHVSVSGVFSTAFRQPTLNELYRSFRVGNVVTLANDSLTAERATSGEAAVIVRAFDSRVYLRTGPFCTRIANTVSNITLATTPSLITRQRQNVGSTRSCGLESDLRLDPSREWSISAGYLFVDSIVTAMPGNATLVGLELPQVARHSLTAQLKYAPRKVGTFSAQFRASSPQWDDDLNTLRLRGYTTLDLSASRSLSSKATVYVAAQNVTDRRIESGRTPVLTLAQPRTFRVGLRLSSGKK